MLIKKLEILVKRKDLYGTTAEKMFTSIIRFHFVLREVLDME